MRGRTGMALWQVIVVVGSVVVAGGVMILVGVLATSGLRRARELTNRTVCMSNLSGINKALIIYRASNDDAWPWLYDTISEWDTTTVGTNRNVSPFGPSDDPNNPKRRSLTSPMFLLVRMNQSAGMFRCPSDRRSRFDDGTRAGADDGDVLEGEYYWDFSQPNDVSYSWQAPIWTEGRFVQGVDDNETETVVIADMTPAATKPGWKPGDASRLTGSAVEAQNSPNHRGVQNNVLRVAGNIQAKKRPDAGMDNDNIYTASGDLNAGSQSATSLDIRKHLSPADTFLIGPVGRKAE